MQRGRLIDFVSHAPVVATVYRTTSAFERLRGLLARQPPGPDDGLLIVPCASIHTLCMKYAIDIVYLDRDCVVTRVVPTVVPWRFSFGPGARMTLELAAGSAVRLGLGVGRRLQWETDDPS